MHFFPKCQYLNNTIIVCCIAWSLTISKHAQGVATTGTITLNTVRMQGCLTLISSRQQSPIYMVPGIRDNPFPPVPSPPRVTLGEATFHFTVEKIKPTIHMMNENSSRGRATLVGELSRLGKYGNPGSWENVSSYVYRQLAFPGQESGQGSPENVRAAVMRRDNSQFSNSHINATYSKIVSGGRVVSRPYTV